MKTRRNALAAAALALPLLAGTSWAQAPGAGGSTPKPLPKGVEPFELAQYNSFTWYGRFGYTNCAFLDLGDGVLVVDTGWTKKDAENLKAQIAEKTKGKPVKWIVMTQTDLDVNGGIEAFLPTDATVFVHARAVEPLTRNLLKAAPGRKSPTVVGVADRLFVGAGGRRLELLAAPKSAHSAYDLVVYCHDNGIAFVGDLVTPGRCPNLLNPVADPTSWIEMIGKIRELQPAGLVGSLGNPSKIVLGELEQTEAYLQRIVRFLLEQKAKSAPEARVAAELAIRPIGDYCPGPVDNANALALYKRMQPDGTFSVPKPPVAARPGAPAPR